MSRMRSGLPLVCLLLAGALSVPASAKQVRHYVFFGMDRERIHDTTPFLASKRFEGAQIAYSWRQLEPEKDAYDFGLIREDLAFLESKGKRLFVQLQDVTFSPSRKNVPPYLLADPKYNGGVAEQYAVDGDDDARATLEGWMARRWDPAVQERLHKLFAALGKEFDGRIEGINLAESSAGFGETGRLYPKGFTPEIYRDAIVANMAALKRAFPKSVVIQYANFMPGEWRPTDDKGYLRAVYTAARRLGVGVGGPDLLPHRPGQLGSSYPLIHEAAANVPVGIAVQDGNYADRDPKTGRRVTVSELVEFASGYLGADYIFWCTEEPYFEKSVVPFVERRKPRA
jgi:hypothetical protein